jgi:hypothetical protein
VHLGRESRITRYRRLKRCLSPCVRPTSTLYSSDMLGFVLQPNLRAGGANPAGPASQPLTRVTPTGQTPVLTKPVPGANLIGHWQNPVLGIGVLECHGTSRFVRFFLCISFSFFIMSGWAERPKGRPGRDSGTPTSFSPAPMIGVMLPGNFNCHGVQHEYCTTNLLIPIPSINRYYR